MYRMQSKSGGFVLVIALFVFGWTDIRQAPGAVADEAGLADLSLNDVTCSSLRACDNTPAAGYRTHWVSKTRSGNLFLVLQAHCADTRHCRAWFVERTPEGVDTRLSVDGRFRVLRSGNPIPDVQTWRDVSANQTEYTSYSWVSGAYLMVESRTVYRVDGIECGTSLDCHEAAVQAHERNHTDKALRIWEQVHYVSWI